MSKRDFWMCPKWKRAMVFVFLVRYLLGFTSQKLWSKFSIEDYKLNIRVFNRWLTKDHLVMKRSKVFEKLPEMVQVVKPKRKKKAKVSASSSESPMKRRFVVLSDTTDSE